MPTTVCAKFALKDMLQDVSALMGLVTLTFDLLTLKLVLVASKVGNLLSEFGHTRPSVSRVIRYVRDGQKQILLPPFLWAGA